MSYKRIEKEYERLCSMILDGTASCEKIPVALDNLFYERFGMNVREIQAELELQMSQKLPSSIDIAAEFH